MMYAVDFKAEAKFGEQLVAEKVLSPQALEEALRTSRSSNRPLIEVLVRDHQADEAALYAVLSRRSGLPYRDLKHETVDPAVVRRVPVKIASHYGFMPLRFDVTGNLLVAVEAPLPLKVQDEIRLQLGHGLVPALARRHDILDCFRRYYGFAADTVDRIVSGAGFEAPAPSHHEQEISTVDEAGRMAGDRTVVDLVNEIIFEALQKRATDIHFEPYRGQFRIRYRIDGVLQDANLTQKAQPIILFVLSRIKIMANLDVIEKRLPQDGRAIVRIDNQTLDLRISTIPTLNGESIVVRILPTKMIFDLKKLGLSDKNLEVFEELIQKPNGIVLLTGPTGSGKTTTLYACLNRMNSNERKIITIEDPVEYEISGITQIPVNPKAGLDFAKGLRSILRHDPDVLMVGEIRDFETAEISIRAALTGHLVFSTLHTNDASSGVSRLLDIGVEPFLVASSVEAIIAQRLVRRICPKCKVRDEAPPAKIAQKIAQDLGAGPIVPIYKGKGCEQCGFTGFFGRTAIHEILVMSEALKQLIVKKAPTHEIKARAVEEGMTTLLNDGWQKVVAGETVPAEVLNVVASEPVASTEKTAAAPAPASPGSPEPRNSRLYRRAVIPSKMRDFKAVYRLVSNQGKISDEEPTSGMVENISASGVLFRSPRLLSLGQVLELQFVVPCDPPRAVDCLARVVRVEETDREDMYEAGTMFLDISSADRAALDRFVKSLQADE